MHNTISIYRTSLTTIALLLSIIIIATALPLTGSAQEAPPDTAPGSTLDQRVEQRKKERNAPLVDQDQNSGHLPLQKKTRAYLRL